MSCDIEAVVGEASVFRLGRRPDPWAWLDWAFADRDGTFGNRYDDPQGEYRVLYASSERVGAFVETLARFRPDPVLVEAIEAIEDEDDDPFAPGRVPSEWLAGRMVGAATLSGELADVGSSRSLVYLRRTFDEVARAFGVAELDSAAIRRGVPRAFTQALSRHVFECRALDASAQFAGIKYLSRLGTSSRTGRSSSRQETPATRWAIRSRRASRSTIPTWPGRSRTWG